VIPFAVYSIYEDHGKTARIGSGRGLLSSHLVAGRENWLSVLTAEARILPSLVYLFELTF